MPRGRTHYQPHDPVYWNRLRGAIRRDPALNKNVWSEDEVEYMWLGIEEFRRSIAISEAIYHRWRDAALINNDKGES